MTPSTTTVDLSQIETEFDSLQVNEKDDDLDGSSGIGASPSTKSMSSSSSAISFRAGSTPDRPNTLDLKQSSDGLGSDKEVSEVKENEDEWKVGG